MLLQGCWRVVCGCMRCRNVALEGPPTRATYCSPCASWLTARCGPGPTSCAQYLGCVLYSVVCGCMLGCHARCIYTLTSASLVHPCLLQTWWNLLSCYESQFVPICMQEVGSLRYVSSLCVQVVGGNWVELPAGRYTMITNRKATHSQLEAHVHYKDLISHAPEGACIRVRHIQVYAGLHAVCALTVWELWPWIDSCFFAKVSSPNIDACFEGWDMYAQHKLSSTGPKQLLIVGQTCVYS